METENGLTAFYKAEYETFADDGEKGSGDTFSQRNIYAGVKGGFGKAMIGMFDTPLKTAQKKVDLFGDLEGDIKSIITRNDNRGKNVVSYATPSMNGVVGTVAMINSEVDGGDDGISTSVTWSNDVLYVAAAMDQDVEAVDSTAMRLVAQYKMDAFQFGALYESYEPDSVTDSVSGFLISAKYSMDKLALKAQMGNSDIMVEGGSSVSVGADYKLAKNVKLYGFLTTEGADDDADADNTYLGFGTEFKF